MLQVFLLFTSDDLEIPNLPSRFQPSDSSYIGVDQILWYPLASCHRKTKVQKVQTSNVPSLRPFSLNASVAELILETVRVSLRDVQPISTLAETKRAIWVLVQPSESSWNRNLHRARGNLESIGNCALCKEGLASDHWESEKHTEIQISTLEYSVFCFFLVYLKSLPWLERLSVMCLDGTRNPGILSDTPDFHIVTWDTVVTIRRHDSTIRFDVRHNVDRHTFSEGPRLRRDFEGVRWSRIWG